MTYGLHIFNSLDARPLVDAERMTFAYHGSHTMSVVTDTLCPTTTRGWEYGMSNRTHSVLLPKSVYPTAPLTFFELPSYPAGVSFGYSESLANDWKIYAYASPGHTPVIHTFRRLTEIAGDGSGYGLQVFDPDGARVFDSTVAKPLSLLLAPYALQGQYFSSTIDGNGYYHISNFNDTTWATGIDLPPNVLMRAFGFACGEYDFDLGPKYDEFRRGYARLFGRSGNSIVAFGMQVLTCSGSVALTNVLGVTDYFNGGPWTPRILLADRSLYA